MSDQSAQHEGIAEIIARVRMGEASKSEMRVLASGYEAQARELDELRARFEQLEKIAFQWQNAAMDSQAAIKDLQAEAAELRREMKEQP